MDERKCEICGAEGANGCFICGGAKLFCPRHYYTIDGIYCCSNHIEAARALHAGHEVEEYDDGHRIYCHTCSDASQIWEDERRKLERRAVELLIEYDGGDYTLRKMAEDLRAHRINYHAVKYATIR